MKSLVEFPFIGFIFTVTLMASTIVYPATVKIAADKELVYTYQTEKAQYSLLALMSSVNNGKKMYEEITTNYVLNLPTSTKMDKFAELVGQEYCISIQDEGALGGSPQRHTNDIMSDACNSDFNSIIVLPYNKDALVKVIRIDLE